MTLSRYAIVWIMRTSPDIILVCRRQLRFWTISLHSSALDGTAASGGNDVIRSAFGHVHVRRRLPTSLRMRWRRRGEFCTSSGSSSDSDGLPVKLLLPQDELRVLHGRRCYYVISGCSRWHEGPQRRWDVSRYSVALPVLRSFCF